MLLEMIKYGTLLLLTIPSLTNLLTALKSKGKRIKENYEEKVSVIIRNWNDESVIERAIKQILKQDYPKEKIEIIIIDESEKDNSELYKKYPTVKFLKMKHKKLKAENLDEAIKIAKGKIILEIDADGVLPKNWIKEMAKPFKDQEVGGVTGRVFCGNWYRKSLLVKIRTIEDFWQFSTAQVGKYNLCGQTLLYGSSKAYRKKVWKEVGGHPRETLVEDAEISAKILDEGYKIVAVDVPALYEEVENLKQYFAERKRWAGGDVEFYKKYRKEIKRHKLLSYLLAVNHGIDGINLLSILLLPFSLMYLLPITINAVAVGIGMKIVKAKKELYPWIIPYILINPFLQVAALVSYAKDILVHKEKKWEKVWHHPIELKWPVENIKE